MNFQSLSNSVYETKYQLKDKFGNLIDQIREDTYWRVAKALAVNEEDSKYWANQFFWAMHNGAVPAGRILSNAGAGEHKPNTSQINCVLSKTIEDSIDGISTALQESLMSLSGGSGIGYEFSTLRPRGAFVNGVGAKTSGPLPFADIFDKACFTIASAGGRRGAQMATFDLRHPDVKDFITIKREDGRFRQFNISVLVPDSFMDFSQTDWQFRFPARRNDPEFNSLMNNPEKMLNDYWHVEDSAYHTDPNTGLTSFKVYDSIPKSDLWDLIMRSNYDYAEPGIIFIDSVNRDNTLYFCEDIRATNPCLTGDTCIAVVGRGPVPIAQLQEEGKDVLVYSAHPDTGEVEVKMGRNPRITGHDQDVWRVVLDDGTSIKATANHKFFLRDLRKVELKDLAVGDSLYPIHFGVKSDWENPERRDVQVKGPEGSFRMEYHLVAEHKHGRKFEFSRHTDNLCVHHVDHNWANNDPSNLQVMTNNEHNSLHLSDPQQNPMQKGWWESLSLEGKAAYRAKMSEACCGSGNGMWDKSHSEHTKRLISKKAVERNQNPEFKIFHSNATKKGMTLQVREKISVAKTKPKEVLERVCLECEKIFEVERPIGSTSPNYDRKFCSTTCAVIHRNKLNTGREMSDGAKALISKSAKEFAKSEKGHAAKSFAGKISASSCAAKCGSLLLFLGHEISPITWDSFRGLLKNNGVKRFVSSSRIAELWNGDWDAFTQASRDYNHKVLAIEYVGKSTVYNITVDDNHNYFVIPGGVDAAKLNYRYSGCLLLNCGEQPLPPNGSCLLGSVDLTRFVENPFSENPTFNFSKFESVVQIFTRLLDNVVEFNGLPVQSQRDEIVLKRRHGMGIIGLGSALAMLKVNYDSDKAREFADLVMQTLVVEGYKTGLELAKEKGPAPIMNRMYEITPNMCRYHPELEPFIGKAVSGRKLWAKSHFMQKVFTASDLTEDEFAQHGCRFTHHASIAPTGTISLAMCNGASGGVEPSFSHKYFRNVTVEGKKTRQQEVVYSHEAFLYKELNGLSDDDVELPDYFTTADELSWKAHVEMVATVQYWTDSGVSKTVNVPTDIPYEEFKQIYQYAYDKGCKSITTYRYNPETLGAILSRSEDLEKSRYEFTLADGSTVEVKGSDFVEYDGEVTTAENLFNSLKENNYGKF